jgi:hypothetical protein
VLSEVSQGKVKPFRQKYNTSVFRKILSPPVPPPSGGAYRDRNGRWERDAMNVRVFQARFAAPTKTSFTYGEIVWSRSPTLLILPTLGSSFAGDDLRSDGGNKARSPIRSPRRARISRSNHCAGNVGSFGVAVVTCLRAFLCCTQGCGCDRSARHSLRPPFSRGQASSKPRAAGKEICVHFSENCAPCPKGCGLEAHGQHISPLPVSIEGFFWVMRPTRG